MISNAFKLKTLRLQVLHALHGEIPFRIIKNQPTENHQLQLT